MTFAPRTRFAQAALPLGYDGKVMRVWWGVVVGAVAVSGCRRDNPAWLRATDVGATDVIASATEDATLTATEGTLSGSESAGMGTTGPTFEERMCGLDFNYETNLNALFPALTNDCPPIPKEFWIRRNGNTVVLFSDEGCSQSVGQNNLHQALIGRLPEDTCLYLLHGGALEGFCKTEYAVVYESAAVADGAPLLAFSREYETPAPFADHPDGFTVSTDESEEIVCPCSTNDMSGEFAPPCCDEVVLRHPIDFEIAGEQFKMAPADEVTGIAFAGDTYRLRVFAAEETAPGTDCAEEQAGEFYQFENIVWILD